MAAETADKTLEPREWLLITLAVTGTWGWLLYHTHYHWGSESYYNFGWFVPLLAAYLFYRRGAAFSFQRQAPAKHPAWAGSLSFLALVLCVFLFFRLFNEANPFWRLPLWSQGILILILNLGFFYLFSGWRGMRHFIFPLIVLLFALPWPWRFEQYIIHALTGWITSLTVMVLNFLGHPATPSGNVIVIGEIRLGVEEACSGIRSLQSLVLVALFVGEFYLFRLPARILMLFAAFFMVLFFNGIRALILAFVSLGHNPESFQSWHDFLGNFNFIASCLLLFLAGEGLNRAGLTQKATGDPLPWFTYGRRKDLLIASTLVLGMLTAQGLVQGYFVYREQSNPPLPGLSVDWESARVTSLEAEPVDEAIRKVLQFDFGQSYRVEWNDGLQALITHYGYTGENKLASVSSFGHSPEICLTSIGGRHAETKPPLQVEIHGQPWLVSHFDFLFARDVRREMMQVFWMVWEPRQMGVSARDLDSFNWASQWDLVVSGRRNFKRQVVLIRFISDRPDEVLRNRVSELLKQVTDT